MKQKAAWIDRRSRAQYAHDTNVIRFGVHSKFAVEFLEQFVGKEWDWPAPNPQYNVLWDYELVSLLKDMYLENAAQPALGVEAVKQIVSLKEVEEESGFDPDLFRQFMEKHALTIHEVWDEYVATQALQDRCLVIMYPFNHELKGAPLLKADINDLGNGESLVGCVMSVGPDVSDNIQVGDEVVLHSTNMGNDLVSFGGDIDYRELRESEIGAIHTRSLIQPDGSRRELVERDDWADWAKHSQALEELKQDQITLEVNQ